MTQKSVTLLNRLENLEKELQKLKIEVLLNLPQRKQKSLYPEKNLLSVIRNTRKAIWQQRYAKKV